MPIPKAYGRQSGGIRKVLRRHAKGTKEAYEGQSEGMQRAIWRDIIDNMRGL